MAFTILEVNQQTINMDFCSIHTKVISSFTNKLLSFPIQTRVQTEIYKFYSTRVRSMPNHSYEQQEKLAIEYWLFWLAN